MTNSYTNSVLFTGDATRVESVMALFEEIEEKQTSTEQWHLPEFVTAKNSFMLDIVLDIARVSYYTMGTPNLEALRQIADYYGVGFTSRYEEPGMQIHGEATYQDGVLQNNYRFGSHNYRFDRGTEQGNYILGGLPSKTVGDISKAITDRKRHESGNAQPDIQDLFITSSNITKEELKAMYGDLPPGDLLLKFAEHKNFEKARELFNSLDEQSVIEMDNFLINAHPSTEQFYGTRDKYIATSFLTALILKWDERNFGLQSRNQAAFQIQELLEENQRKKKGGGEDLDNDKGRRIGR